MAYTPDPNEVGCGWKSQGRESGVKYVRISLDLDKFLTASGGLTNGKAMFNLYVRTTEKTKDTHPDYTLKYTPVGRSAPPRATVLQSELPGDDDEIPF